jgi:DNA polymerase III delta prime subunit
MNKKIANFAREELKKGLSRCGPSQQHLFKQMYARKLDMDVDAIVDEMDDEKLSWAMKQVDRTLAEKAKRVDQAAKSMKADLDEMQAADE